MGRGKENGADKPEGEDQLAPDDAAAQESQTEDASRKVTKHRSFWKELPILIGVALLLTFLIQTFLARVFVIPSESMEHTLHGCAGCYGDRVLVDKVVYAFSDPAPGDVVVFERPTTWNRTEFRANRSGNVVVSWLQDLGAMFGLASPNEDDVVKRVIAVGGQTVEGDEQGRVFVDGTQLNEPYVFWDGGAPNGNQAFDRFRVPEGTLWVMGDNRNNSADSRVQGGGGTSGVVPVDNVIGKARSIVLPPSRWQGVGDHNPQAAFALQAVIPAGVGFAAAWPVVLLSRRFRGGMWVRRRP